MNPNKKRKIWIFYLLEEDHGTDKYDIYAFTDNISYVEGFVKTRNMSKFYMKACKLDKAEYNDLIRHYMNSELDIFEGHTKTSNKYKSKEFEIVLTRREKIQMQSISSLYINDYIYKNVWDSPFVFKKKYQKALDILKYSGLHDFVVNGVDSYMSVEEVLTADDFNFILNTYGNLFQGYIDNVEEGG